MKYVVEVGKHSYEVEVRPDGVLVDGRRVEADLEASDGSPLYHLVLDGRSLTLRARRRDGRGAWQIEVNGRPHDVLALDERRRAIRDLAGAAADSNGPVELSAPMPGLVVAVEVAEGEAVECGRGLVVIEAMKMENELKAPAAGRVSAIRVAPGQAVEKGDTLVVIDTGDDAG